MPAINDDLPDTPLERAKTLQDILIERATSSEGDEAAYVALRREFMDDSTLRPLLPEFVRGCRNLTQFFGRVRELRSYAERRAFVWSGFSPFLDYLESAGATPVDHAAAEVLHSFD